MLPDTRSDTVSVASKPQTAFLIADPSGDCIQVSSRWAEVTGLDPLQTAGSGWLDLAHPDDRDSLRSEWAACVAGKSDFAMRIRLQVKGESVDLRATRMPVGFVVVVEAAEHEKSDAELL